MANRTSSAALFRAVRLTARSSALLFAAAQATRALRPTAVGAWRSFYLGFMAAHATHFALVARYARVTGGRALFPGGRNLDDVGGWPTVGAIYTLFSGLALTGWAGGAFPATRGGLHLAGRVATGIIGAMFVGTYAGQVPRSAWYAAPAITVGATVIANLRTGIHPSAVSARWVADPTRTEVAAS